MKRPSALCVLAMVIGFNSWSIPQGTDQADLAADFIAFATRAENMAAQANLISYGPARTSAQGRVGLHTDAGVPMRAYMPTAPAHMDSAVTRDHRWYSQTVELREKWFSEWLER
ncbi:MAG: extracellular solute-binding protein [Marinobacter sp.]